MRTSQLQPTLVAPVTAFPAASNSGQRRRRLPCRMVRIRFFINGRRKGPPKMKKSKSDIANDRSLYQTLQMRLDNALLENQRLRELIGSINNYPSCLQVSKSFADFNYFEISEATSYFEHFIGEDDFGDTYKGRLRHTDVAIKVLHSHGLLGPFEFLQFLQEVDTLSKIRHPNIATLIGVCEEPSALVYEYLPNGSLEDRLACKGNTPPLSWQTRIRIATELCSVLMFLQSCRPKSIIHGDLKPANILLDACLSCKLSNLGINHPNRRADPIKWTSLDPYMDPEFILTEELNPKLDVFSFGIILLRLLTGKPALGLQTKVQNAVDKGNLGAILDRSAGNWLPFVQAEQLALLGLRCCSFHWKTRPDLEADAWRVLQPMKASSSSSTLVTYSCCEEEYDHAPSYFICPILQEVMHDPHIAADGFTYEGEALEAWLDSGHHTSPMTNLKLEDETLTPNRSLRSAIQEWRQQRRSTL